MSFLIFPLEVWELLLDTMPPEDAYNVYLAFPDLREESVIKNKIPKWLFILVAHRICASGWLSKNEILGSRLVCRHWCRGIDDVLQLNPKYFPFPYGAESNPFQDIGNGESNIVEKVLLFEDVEGLQDFQVKVAPPGQSRNLLFVFRGVRLTEGPGGDLAENGMGPLTPFWREGLDFLEARGEALWFLSVSSEAEAPVSFVQFILQCLEFTPNLKTFQIWAMRSLAPVGVEEVNGIVEEFSGNLPSLEQLAILDLWGKDVPESLTRCLVMAYGKQLKGLSLTSGHWRDDYVDLFSRLTELELHHGVGDEVSRILSSIQSPFLVKLYLWLEDVRPDGDNSKQFIIVPILPRFPCLEYLGLYGNRFYFDGPPKEVPPSITEAEVSVQLTRIPSVRSLDIQLGNNLDLLMCFPNLRNLLVELPMQHVNLFGESHQLWEVGCPRLEIVYAKGYEDGELVRQVQYDRGYYNRRKAERGSKQSGSGGGGEDFMDWGIARLFLQTD